MIDLSPSTLILIAIFLLVAFPVHEFAHAFVGVPARATGRPRCSAG